MHLRFRGSLLVLAALVLSASAAPQTPRPQWQDQWDAFETMVAMRDGKKLHTVYFVPKGKPGPFPILMERTPYGAGSANRPPQRTTPKLVEAGYILAFQDVRGTGSSEGDFIDVRPLLAKGKPGTDESTDTYDTVEWLVKNVQKNNGRVGLWGISYPGFYAGAGGVRSHPALKAISPQAPVNDWFLGDDVHHRGAFFLQETFDFMIFFNTPRGVQPPRIDRQGLSAYDFFLRAGALSNYDAKFLKGAIPYWQELMENDTYNQYWKDRALWRSFRDVGCAVLTVGGWFDKEDLWGALNLYKAGEKQNPRTPNYLVMGPWSHGQWAGRGGASLGDFAWGSPTGTWYQENVEFPFFERYLRGDDKVKAPAEATVFETGANEWRTFSAWPPKEAKTTSLYLDRGRTISWTKPAAAGRETYVNDPSRPTPYLADYQTSRRAPGDWLAKNQAFLEARTDTVTFRSQPLAADTRIAGPIFADMWITTTGTDCDLVVQLIDEFPSDTDAKKPNGESMAGVQMMVRGEIMRAKFRNSWEKPEPLPINTPVRVRFELNDALHTFKKGHRIAVRVMSNWFPIADRNPNTFVSRTKATDADFKSATISILTGNIQPSRIEFGALPAAKPAGS